MPLLTASESHRTSYSTFCWLLVSHVLTSYKGKETRPCSQQEESQVKSCQMWAKEGRWVREDEDLETTFAQWYLTQMSGQRWPEGRMSLISGHNRKYQSGIWISGRRATPWIPGPQVSGISETVLSNTLAPPVCTIVISHPPGRSPTRVVTSCALSVTPAPP